MRVSVLLVLSALLPAVSMAARGTEKRRPSYNRDDFPASFVFGSGTSAYQVEGAADEDGRTPSTWDTFAHSGIQNESADITSDEYHKYKEDVKLMSETGLEGYRFSISWSRLIPNGRGNINPIGLQYYNNLISELISQGIKPYVTLCHFDIPQALEDEYGGWLSPKVIDDFTAYANVCFREFGDRVSHWTTINECNVFPLGGYGKGILPPRRCSYPFGHCAFGDSTTEPYIVGHYLLLAHGSAASLYKKKYQAQQQGFIGLNILGYNFQPLTSSTNDINAVKRLQDFYMGWFVEPLLHGDYPESMRKLTDGKMPEFSRDQSEQIKGSSDFIGLNYYLTIPVADDPNSWPADQRNFTRDARAKFIGNEIVGLETTSMMASSGLQRLLEHFKQAYGNPPVYIHENGYPLRHNTALNDSARVKHTSSYFESLLDSIRNGSNTQGFFTWSFVDLYEAFSGYETTYGHYYVDFESSERKRYPKLSARWYANFLKGKRSVIRIENDYSHVSPPSISVM